MSRPYTIFSGQVLRNATGRWRGARLRVLYRADRPSLWIVESLPSGQRREITEATLLQDYEYDWETEGADR